MEDIGLKGFKQLCWQCKKSCNSNLCIWVKTLKIKPQGVKLDKQGYIVECPEFEKDNGIYTKEEYIKSLGLTQKEYRQIYNAVLGLLNKNIKASINECINFINKTGGICKDYVTIKSGLVRGNLEYMPLDYAYKQLQKSNYQNMASFVRACNRDYKETLKDAKKIEREKNGTLHDKIENYCKQLGITRDLYIKINLAIKRYNKKSIKTNFEECVSFIKKTGAEYWVYFTIKQGLQNNNLEYIPLDYVYKQLQKPKFRCMADFIKACNEGEDK